MAETLVKDARVMSKGQVTIPKNIRTYLGINSGDRVTFVVEDGTVKVINSAVYAMKKFQKEMAGEAEKSGFYSEEDIDDWITASRRREQTT